jgi:hypothetical protein
LCDFSYGGVRFSHRISIEAGRSVIAVGCYFDCSRKLFPKESYAS